ncbi:MAG: response regulator transcription factor, partial [Solirubrobacteraceae bacterium]
SAKQLETVRLVAQGLTNSEIAKRMFVSEATVKWHVKQILAKTGSANRTEAVARVLGASPQRMDRSS